VLCSVKNTGAMSVECELTSQPRLLIASGNVTEIQGIDFV